MKVLFEHQSVRQPTMIQPVHCLLLASAVLLCNSTPTPTVSVCVLLCVRNEKIVLSRCILYSLELQVSIFVDTREVQEKQSSSSNICVFKCVIVVN